MPLSQTMSGQLSPLHLSESDIAISVIIPLHDDRFQSKFIKAWTQNQTCADPLYEILIIGDSSHYQLEKEIRQWLRPHDQLWFESGHRSHRYHAAIQKARGSVLLITEDHCIPNKNCIQTVYEAFTGSTIAGLHLNCGHMNRSSLSELESEHVDRWSGCHEWNIFLARGTALRKEVYDRSPGLVAKYSFFAEPILGRHLFEMGCRFKTTDECLIRHVNSFSWEDFNSDISQITYGQCNYNADHPDCDYFSPTPGWTNRHRWHPATQKTLSQLARLATTTCFPRQGTFYFLKEWTKRPLLTVGRSALTRIIFDIQLFYLRIKCLRTLNNPELRRSQFAAYLNQVALNTGFHFQLDHGDEINEIDFKLENAPTLTAETLAHTASHAFYLLEKSESDTFTWSHSLACLWLQLSPGQWKVCITTASFFNLKNKDITFMWNGVRIRPQAIHPDQNEITLIVDSNESSNHTSTALSWAAYKRPKSSDTRKVGIPVTAIKFTAVDNANSAL
jgi:hypothetical protein